MLAIDPGFIVAGYSILKIVDSNVVLCDCNVLKQSSSKKIEERLLVFSQFFEKHIINFGITDLALETPFLGKNAQNFLKLGYLRGALLLLAAEHSLCLHERSPREIKLQVTGYGAADKEQVARAVRRFFPQLPSKLPNDATDSLALAFSLLHNF